MDWRYLGSISDAKKCGCSGVYLIVHKGKFDRVVYVGVSNNVGRRITEHYNEYLRGNRTIYNAGYHDDVYKFMSSYKVHNHITHYKNLAANYNLWGCTTLYAEPPKNLLAKEQYFSFLWKDILLNKYLPQLVVWALPMTNYNYTNATKIESVIQTKLITRFYLRGFFNVKEISILGKIEHPLLKKISTNIGTLNLEPASELIFSNLDSITIPVDVKNIFCTQLQEELSSRDKNKEKVRLAKAQKVELYKNYGKYWTIEDLEKLRVMLVDFRMTPHEISSYLHRQPKAIIKRISDNDKLSNKKWREHLKWL